MYRLYYKSNSYKDYDTLNDMFREEHVTLLSTVYKENIETGILYEKASLYHGNSLTLCVIDTRYKKEAIKYLEYLIKLSYNLTELLGIISNELREETLIKILHV